MRISFKVMVAALGIMGFSMQAEALTITAPVTPVVNCVLSPVCLAGFGNETGQAQIDPIISAIIPGAEILGYTQNVGGAEVGPGAPYYSMTFQNTPTDPSDALLTWNGPLFFTTNPLYILVKDGNQSPAWYLFRLTVGAGGWNGMETLDFQDFWPNQGAISHISIYGTPAPGTPGLFNTPVPDGGSMTMLLGMGLMGLAALRRRML